MSLCPHCMRPAAGNKCPHCGKDLQWQNGPGQLPVGTVLEVDGHTYELGAPLGQGGFGITYIGAQRGGGRRVAVKEYYPARFCRRGEDGVAVEPKPGSEELYDNGRGSFVKEARMLASLEGMPSVVQGLAYLERNNTAYLVMEYLDGELLAHIIQQRGKLTAEELLPPLKSLMHDIGRLHRIRVVHRDITPNNIMWMPDGSLKLLDFGSARSVEGDKSLTVATTKGFAPPEQYSSHGQGPWTDVYALAATVFCCLTGEIPPDAYARSEGTALPSPIALGAALTPEEEKALLWGLSLRRQDRPQDMDALSRALFPYDAAPAAEETGQKGVSAGGAQPGLWQRFRAWVRNTLGI